MVDREIDRQIDRLTDRSMLKEPLHLISKSMGGRQRIIAIHTRKKSIPFRE
jgi:hypothetical protein